jgi:hypothetical protein
MPDTFAILALRRKRAHLAGEIEAAERRIVPLRATLAQLDAVIRLFEPNGNPELIPSIRPSQRNLFFRHGEQMRLCLDALRDKGGPMQARSVAEYAMLMKGLPVDDKEVRTTITEQVRWGLSRLERRGLVRRVIVAPDVWWELVGTYTGARR